MYEFIDVVKMGWALNAALAVIVIDFAAISAVFNAIGLLKG